MPYVPVPAGSSVSWPNRPESTFQTYLNGRLSGSGSQLCAPNSFSMAGGRTFAGGKPISVNGKIWRPARPYQRYATVVDYVPGVSYLRDNNPLINRTQRWVGYPAPYSVWKPVDNLSAGVGGGLFTVDVNGVGTISANARNRINTELLVKAGRRNVNWGEAIGESKSTFRMLASSASTLARAILAARRGKFNLVAKILRRPRLRFPNGTSVGSKWLAYQYGWKPLMGDIYDSYQHLKKGFDTRLQVLSVSRFLREVAEDTRPVTGFKEMSIRTEARLGGKMFFRIADSWLANANQVGMINPLEVAWAVVPFSFVVDWFIPVGSLLEALSARMSVNFIDGYYGISLKSVGRKTGCNKANAGYTSVASTCSVRRETSSYRRTVMTGLPWPAPYFKSPFSTSHVTSALALIAQLLKR